jgi:hypothetical protein
MQKRNKNMKATQRTVINFSWQQVSDFRAFVNNNTQRLTAFFLVDVLAGELPAIIDTGEIIVIADDIEPTQAVTVRLTSNALIERDLMAGVVTHSITGELVSVGDAGVE